MDQEIKEEYGINAMNRKAKSQIIKGLDSNEAIVLIFAAGGSVFFALVLFMVGVKLGLYLQPITLGLIYLTVNVLKHFHKIEKPGYIVSFLSYLIDQPKKIYVRTGGKIFEK